ncbi:MAG: ABC transporter ATP-binding protein [Hyphomicrobiaceae bacterium]|jgi:branched-chain amino acid transport system ATP-binding protein
MGGPLLEAEGVTKRYGGLVANDAVTMTLQPGEVRGLIGPNGAGKTTFVNLLTGFETLDAGRISLGGTDLTGLPANQIAARGLVRTFQVARVFANMSVRENLLLPFLAAGSPGGVLEGQARARELLAASTLEHMAEEPAGALSGGQRMLLQACAGFMIPSARLHVLDEPFAGINPVVKDTLIALIERENKSAGRAFLIVSHEMAIVRRLCPRVTVMIQGRVAAEGTLEEVARRPDVVQAYLGSAAA